MIFKMYVGMSPKIEGNISDTVIDAVTGHGGYVHAFVWIPDLALVWEAHSKFGVRFSDREPTIEEVLYEIPDMRISETEDVFREMCRISGSKYDLSGAVGSSNCFGHSLMRQNPEAYFCSEGVVSVLQKAEFFKGIVPYEISPNELIGLLAAEGFTVASEIVLDAFPLPPMTSDMNRMDFDPPSAGV